MARIRDEDVVTVRERARIDEVVREVVTLKPAGGGSFKGLCPFHDERSPSFHVTPAKGFYHCFGCQAGGDVIDFVKEYDHLTFAEAVEKLAGRYGVQLRYEEGGATSNRLQGQRTRLIAAHKAAAEFYVQQLAGAEAATGRTFLAERGFNADAAAQFGVGYAPKSWDALVTHLRKAGFTDDEMLAGGLVARGNRGVYDRFRGRLVWPIRDLSGDVIGFGARKLYDDDEGPKYLNTPETPIYKKSQVLYGIDLARREISKSQRAVVVEGYTDVMAAHLAGVPTAVATCGTAFGGDHIKVLRRLLMDQDELRGEVIFTFDGDEAGQRAAMKAFELEQRFVSQTFVAIEPNGLDPCELRIESGDEAVRDLVARRQPLVEFVLRSTLAGYDLDSVEGRVAGLRAAAPLVARIRDQAARPEYIRQVAGWLGMDAKDVQREVSAASRKGGRGASTGSGRRTAPAEDAKSRGADGRAGAGGSGVSPAGEASNAEVGDEASAGGVPATEALPEPDRRDPQVAVQREALKCVLQLRPESADWFEAVEVSAFTEPAYQAVCVAVQQADPGVDRTDSEWATAVLDACGNDAERRYVRELSVEPLRADLARDPGEDDEDPETRYASAVLARLLELDATRRIVEVKAKLQRLNPETQADEYRRLFTDLLALESYRRDLREQAVGGE